MVATAFTPKKKKPSAFDAFFDAADAGNAAQAQTAFNQAGGTPQSQQTAQNAQAQTAFNQGGFADFFSVGDQLAGANAGTTDVQTASDRVAQILANPNGEAPARINAAGQALNAADGTPPPPPPPPPPGGNGAGLFSAGSGEPLYIGQGTGTTATVAGGQPPATNPNASLTDADNARIEEYRQEFERDLAKQIAAGNFDPSGIARGLRSGGSRGLSVQGDAAVRQLLAEYDQKLLNYKQAGSTNAIEAQAPTASTVNNGALAREATLAPNANQSSGNNMAILSLLADGAGLDLPINGELRQNQAATVAEMLNQADRAGQEAVTGLALPDLTASNVPARTLSSLEQATEQRALDRLTGGRFINPEQPLVGSAEQVILDRLAGGDNPALAALRADLDKQIGRTRAQDLEELNTLGVLRGGDNIETLLRLREREAEGQRAIDALGFDLQSQAIDDAFGFAGRRDNLNLAEQDLQRAAISDARGISDTRNNLDLNEASLSGNLRGEATLPARQAQADLQFRAADQQQDITDRTFARLLTQTSPTELERFTEGVRQAKFGESLAGDANRRADQALQSDLFGEVQLNANGPATRTLGGQSFDLNKLLSLNADDRAERGLDDNLLTSDLNRLLARNSDQRAQVGLNDALANSTLNRTLARNADERSQQALLDALFGEVDGQTTLSGEANTRANRANMQDVLNAIQGRTSQRAADNRAQIGLDDDLLTSELNRLLAGNADTRAGAAQDKDFGNQRITQLLAAAEAGLITKDAATDAILEALGLGPRADVRNPQSDPVNTSFANALGLDNTTIEALQRYTLGATGGEVLPEDALTSTSDLFIRGEDGIVRIDIEELKRRLEQEGGN